VYFWKDLKERSINIERRGDQEKKTEIPREMERPRKRDGDT